MLADGFIVRNTFIDVEHVLFDGDMLRLPRRPHSSPPSLAPFRPHSEPTTEVEVDEDDAVSQTISLEDHVLPALEDMDARLNTRLSETQALIAICREHLQAISEHTNLNCSRKLLARQN